jgi:hypothetical protein
MNATTTRIMREEAWRSAVWLLLGFIGWAMILTSTTVLPTNALTFVGLPVVTAIVLFALMVTIRHVSGRELKADTDSKILLLALSTAVVGFYLVWAYLTANWTIRTTALAAILVLTLFGYIARSRMAATNS